MIKFNELKITPDGKNLIIDISVKDYRYYDDITIDKVIIDTQDTFIINGPSDSPLYSYTVEGEEKNIRIELNNIAVPLNNMLFVYVVAKGTPSPDTPCGYDNNIVMQTVVDLYPFYQETLCYLNEINKDCNIPRNFINMILRLKALELCVRTGNYLKAIKYWNKFFSGKKVVIHNTCTCNG